MYIWDLCILKLVENSLIKLRQESRIYANFLSIFLSWPRKIGPEKYSQFDKIGIAKDFGFKEVKRYVKEDKDRRYN